MKILYFVLLAFMLFTHNVYADTYKLNEEADNKPIETDSETIIETIHDQFVDEERSDPIDCITNEDCPIDTFCTSTKFCKQLCQDGTAHDGTVCAEKKETPECAIEMTGHMSYCACTVAESASGDSCPVGYSCQRNDNKYECVEIDR